MFFTYRRYHFWRPPHVWFYRFNYYPLCQDKLLAVPRICDVRSNSFFIALSAIPIFPPTPQGMSLRDLQNRRPAARFAGRMIGRWIERRPSVRPIDHMVAQVMYSFCDSSDGNAAGLFRRLPFNPPRTGFAHFKYRPPQPRRATPHPHLHRPSGFYYASVLPLYATRHLSALPPYLPAKKT